MPATPPEPISAEATALLERPLLAVVSTAGRTPHAVPVWYRMHIDADGTAIFTIWSDRSRHWIRRIQRDPAVHLVVAESEAPFGAVLASGDARLSHDNVLEEATRICERYLPPGETPDYVERWSALDSIVELKATTLRAWGRGY